MVNMKTYTDKITCCDTKKNPRQKKVEEKKKGPATMHGHETTTTQPATTGHSQPPSATGPQKPPASQHQPPSPTTQAGYLKRHYEHYFSYYPHY